ncbi:uncharacterized protein LOC135959728 [Calliphora vicina]|uniref:uncharacterized protein LOC135959728 n=1 Tax=Calliphora vicina TaxID=7373 RepID=UPI00325BED50
MSTINDNEIVITFDELRQLDKADISVCVDKYSALSICEKSSAHPGEIYNIWAQKLFKAYDVEDFSSKDWHRIIEHLNNVLLEFVKKLNATNDTTNNQLEQWWLDTQELLKWLEKAINSLDIVIISLILTFVLEIVIKTCKFANKRNLKRLLKLQQLIINLTNNSILKLPIADANEFESFNKVVYVFKVISSLCDVGCLISSSDFKTSIETWRAVVKLSEKYSNCHRNFPDTEIENCTNTETHWYAKAILGIFKELNQIIRLYNRNPASSNDNLLQIAQFYMKILRIIINYSKDKVKTFPATKEFIELYNLCHHDMAKNDNPKIDLLINKGIFDILLLIYSENGMVELILQHLKYDVDNFESCDLVLDYLKVNIENCCKNRLNVRPHVDVLLKLYNCLFEGPLMFIDGDKYIKILEYFVVLTALDSTNELHKKLCEYVLNSSWIRAYASMEILNIYYRNIFNQGKSVANLNCLEFWLKMWNKLNKSNDGFRQHKKLIEVLLKTTLLSITDAKLQHYHCNKLENMEMILLICDKETEQSMQYLQTSLVKNLTKMQERHINGLGYRELLNLLEICAFKPQLLNNHLKENLLATFTGLFSLSPSELGRFREFVNKCLRIFWLKQDKLLNEKLLKYLMGHEQHCCNIQSVFLIEFVLKHRPQSTKLLQALNTYNKLTTSIISLIEHAPLHNKSIDFKVFKDLNKNFKQSSSPQSEQEQIKKKPRLDKGNFSNIKFILNDLHLNTQKLLNFEHSTFDAKDFELMQKIKNNIDKCLTK